MPTSARATKLPALTGLRFFAAAAIVVHHLRGCFGITDEACAGWHLDQGVSLFFVLSGFILYHVYPMLPTWRDRYHFFRARFARIWPAHLAALVLGFAFLGKHFVALPHSNGYLQIVADILLVQGWIPIGQYYFSYNSVSWSISTEMGFYLLFPLIVTTFQRTWWWKLAATIGLAVFLIFLANRLKFPDFAPTYRGVTSHGLLYVNPLGRLFEFVIGMCAGVAWQRTRQCLSWGRTAGTLVELAALALFMGNVTIGLLIAGPLWQVAGAAGQTWLGSAFSALPAGLLISLLASSRGWIGAFLATRPMLLLGEISFSVYLIHQILLRSYVLYHDTFDPLLGIFALPAYLLTVVVLSYTIWVAIEKPMRAFLVGWIPPVIGRWRTRGASGGSVRAPSGTAT